MQIHWYENTKLNDIASLDATLGSSVEFAFEIEKAIKKTNTC